MPILLDNLQIPPADGLALEDVMAIYEALRPAMPEMPKSQSESRSAGRLLDILDRFDGLLLDGYGVINVGDCLIDGIAALLNAAQQQAKLVIVLTNGGSFAAARAWQKYHGWNLPIAQMAVVSSRDALVAGISQSLGAISGPSETTPKMLSTGPRIGCFGANIEPLTVADIPDSQLLVYGRDDDFWTRAEAFVFLGAIGWQDKDQAAFEAAMLANPRPLHVANPDVAAPQEGMFSAEPGYWTARMMQQAARRSVPVDVTWYGKPYQPAFDLAAARMTDIAGKIIDNSRLAMVGDSLHTDILGGGAAGMKTVLMTGHGLFRQISAAPICDACQIYPDWIVETP